MAYDPIKTELLAAAHKGISQYLNSTRGARLGAEVIAIGGNTLQIVLAVPAGRSRDFYEITIKKPWS